MAVPRPPTHSAAQLVQLSQPQALGIFDDHQTSIRHIDPHFDHRGRYQQVNGAGLERSHNRLFFPGLHSAMHQPDV
jgi:hypothetical protein